MIPPYSSLPRRLPWSLPSVVIPWLILFPCTSIAVTAEKPPDRPNILWLIAEDLGPDLACYGDPDAYTPNLDQLAAEGRTYRCAFATGNVCSPSRSAFSTGMYQTSLDAQNHRSHRDDHHRLPAGVRLISDRLREVGYFTANIRQLPPEIGFFGKGKTDWNFEPEGKPFDSDKWKDLKGHQPFYAQVNFPDTHRPYLQHMPYAEHTNPNVNLMRQLYSEGKLNAAQAKFMAPHRPVEELYDLKTDPWELHDLAALPEYKETLARFRSVLEEWIVETDDRGRFPEDLTVVKEILEEHQRKIENLFENVSR